MPLSSLVKIIKSLVDNTSSMRKITQNLVDFIPELFGITLIADVLIVNVSIAHTLIADVSFVFPNIHYL